MSRIAARFAALKREGRGALIPFIEAWDPDAATSLALLRGMPAAGADLIEIGIPFTDPMADGPIVQAAGKRALKAGVKVAHVLDHGARVPPRRRRDADHPDGLSQPGPVLRRRTLLRRCGRGRRRWPDHGRSAHRGGRHPGAARRRARHRHHPPGRADHRRQAAAAGARWQFRLRLLRQHHRHHRHTQHDGRASRRSDSAHPQGVRSADRRRLRRALAGAGGRSGARRRRGGGGLGAVHHDRGESGQAGSRAQLLDQVRELAAGVRGARVHA